MCPLNRFSALLLLLAYAITGTPVLKASSAMLADLDGSHEMFVLESDQITQIVLHPREGAETLEVADHINASLRILLCFCGEDQNGDHHFSPLHLTSIDSAERHLVAEEVIHPVSINFEATQTLRHSFEKQVRYMFRHQMTRDRQQRESDWRATMAGVQLVI
jgi:hypothetical protein